MLPKARKNDLVIQQSGDELLVYDTHTNKATCLNSISAMVWQACDGDNSPYDIRESLEKRLKTPVTEDLVWFALEQLYKEDLLTNEEEFVGRYEGQSRREVIKKIGLSSAVSLPIIASLVAPMAVSAQSACTPNAAGCLPNGNVGCSSPNECCSCNCMTSNGNCVMN